MEFWNTAEAARFFRKMRLKKGFKQEDIAEPGLAVSTVSNIENKKVYVSEKKVRRYCEKIGIDFDKVPQILEQRKIKQEPVIKTQLQSIESLIDCYDPKIARKELRKLEIPPEYVELHAYYYYLLGRSLIPNQSKAERAFFRSMEMIDEHPELKRTNLKAASYCELGVCSYLQNDLK